MSEATHTPVRSCCGCGKRSPRRELVRFVAGGDGLMLDLGRRLPGRGGYLHGSNSCWAEFVGRKPPLRSLRRAVDRKQRAALVEQLRHVAR